MNMAGWWKAGPQRYAAPLDAEHRLTEVAVIRGAPYGVGGYVGTTRRGQAGGMKHELDAEGKPYNRTTLYGDRICRAGGRR